MIIIDNVSKRYRTEHGTSDWVLKDISLVIPPRLSVGLVGRNGAGKSTLLRIIAGVDEPTRGEVRRLCRVSWPMGYGGGLLGRLTGRQNAKFICRIHGEERDIPERLARIEAFAEIGKSFDEPTNTYSSGMRSRLQFAISLAFDFDVYISDEVTAAGDASFRNKAAQAFRHQANTASIIMVSHDTTVLRRFCKAGIWIHNGQAYWFDNVNDAIRCYRGSFKQ